MTRIKHPLEIDQQNNNIIFHRTGGKNNADYVLKDVYKFFVKKHGKVMSYGTFAKICQEYNEFVMDELVTGSMDFYMPCRLGSLCVRKIKAVPYMVGDTAHVEHLPIDYKQTKDLWIRSPEARESRQVVRMTNKHTGGYKYKFIWDKTTINVPNSSVYKFVPTRGNKRDKLAKALKSDERPEMYEKPLFR